MKKVIKFLAILELIIIATVFISFSFFINMQVAFLSSFFIIMGSVYAYRKMVIKKVDSKEYEDQKDLLDTIEDPHELYDKVNDEVREGALGCDTPINDAPTEELNLKEIVKEEKAKIKTLSADSMKYGSKGGASIFRLVPYVFLVLGFIALQNNHLLDLSVYLPSLLVGIVAGYTISKELFATK